MARFPTAYRKKVFEASALPSSVCQSCGRSIGMLHQFFSKIRRHTCYVCGLDICDNCAAIDLTQTDPHYSRYFCTTHTLPIDDGTDPLRAITYRPDFYTPANFIGTTRGGNNIAIQAHWSYYFLSNTEYGRLTQIHDNPLNIGREFVRPRGSAYRMLNYHGRLVEVLDRPIHQSRGSFFLERTSARWQEIQSWGGHWTYANHDFQMLRQVLERFPELKMKYRHRSV